MLAGLGVGTYLIALLAMLPAGMALTSVEQAAVSGTVWNGTATIPAGGQVTWRWDPLRSIQAWAFAADWRVTTAEARLSGRALVRPSGVAIESVDGSADQALLLAIAKNFPVRIAAR